MEPKLQLRVVNGNAFLLWLIVVVGTIQLSRLIMNMVYNQPDYKHTSINIITFVLSYIRTKCIHTYIHTIINTCIHTYIHTYIHTHIHTKQTQTPLYHEFLSSNKTKMLSVEHE